MTTLRLTDEQFLEAFEKLPAEKQAELLQKLLQKNWDRWLAGMTYARAKARAAARKRGRDWDAMSEEQRETFINDVLHEA